MQIENEAKKILLPVIQQEFWRREQDGPKLDICTVKVSRRNSLLLLTGFLILSIFFVIVSRNIAQYRLPYAIGCAVLLLLSFFVSKKASLSDRKLGILMGAACVALFCGYSVPFVVLPIVALICIPRLLSGIFKRRETAIFNMAVQSPNTPVSSIVDQEACPRSAVWRFLQRVAAVSMTVLIIFLILGGLTIPAALDRPGLVRGESTVMQEYGDGWMIVSASQKWAQKTEITVIQEYKGKPIVAIGPDAFAGLTNLRHITLPDTITMIDKRAFEGCTSLQTITLPDGLQSVGGGAFRNCDSLQSFAFPSGVTAIGGECFQNCDRLQEVILPPGITEIRGNTFENCVSLRSIKIPEGVTRIAAHSFRGCSMLQSVYVPDSVTEIGSSAFRKCTSLTEICIPAGAKVNGRAFKESPTKITYK